MSAASNVPFVGPRIQEPLRGRDEPRGDSPSQQQTGVYGPVLPNRRHDDASQDNGGGHGQGRRGRDGTDAQLPVLDSANVRPGHRTLQQPSTQQVKLTRAGDSALLNIWRRGERERNTFARGSLRQPGWDPGGQFTTGQGRPVKIQHSTPNELSQQIRAEQTRARVQTRPMNPSFVANGRYDVPLRV